MPITDPADIKLNDRHDVEAIIASPPGWTLRWGLTLILAVFTLFILVAAVVAGIRLGWLDERVDVETRGGRLTIEWAGAGGNLAAPVRMTGPATTVFEGDIDIPELS